MEKKKHYSYTKLEHLRRVRGLSQMELGKRIGYHNSIISKYERGFERRVSKRFKKKVCKELRASCEIIFGEKRITTTIRCPLCKGDGEILYVSD